VCAQLLGQQTMGRLQTSSSSIPMLNYLREKTAIRSVPYPPRTDTHQY